MRVLKLCLALSVALSAGCAKRVETATSTRSIEEYYPLAVGNKWTYDGNFFGEKRAATVEITKVDEEGFFVDSNDNPLRFDAFGLRDPKRYLLRAPLEQGQTWTSVVSVSSMERYQVQQVGFLCTVPAGEFKDCVRVEGRNKVDGKNTLIVEWTFAPGVGMVAIETTLETEGKRVPQTKLALTSYSLKNEGKP